MSVSAMNARKTPLPATWPKKKEFGPPPPWGSETRSAIPSSTGSAPSTASKARWRHLRKTRYSSDFSNLHHGQTAVPPTPAPPRRPPPGADLAPANSVAARAAAVSGAAVPGAAVSGAAVSGAAVPGAAVPGAVPLTAGPARLPAVPFTSALDIEPLSGQGHEQILQAGPWGVEAGHRYPGEDELAADAFRRFIPQ